MKTTATTEAVSSPLEENELWSQQWRQNTSHAGQKPRADWKNVLQIPGAGRKSRKPPTPFVGYKPNGKSQLERLSTLYKLVAIPKLILKEYEFPKGESLYADLKNLLDLRTSLVHSKPKVTVNDETAHKGNLSKRSSIMALTPEKCVSLPARVVAHIWNYDHGTLAELWINRDFSDSVKRENSKAKARLKQRTKK